jgi:anti-repressor protein
MNSIILPPDSVFNHNGQLVTDSLLVAKHFEKRHDHVLRDIREIGRDLPKIGEIDSSSDSIEDFNRLNFQPIDYTDSKGRTYTKYFITQSGFMLLTMSFTGSKALRVKIAYINRFEEMALELQKRQAPTITGDVVDILEFATSEIKAGRLIIKQKEELIAELAPKAQFHDTVAVAINSQSVEAVAKVLNTGRNRMFEWLREHHYFIGEGQSKNLPYQKWVDSGLFRVVEKTRKNQVGEVENYTQTLVTGKGLTRIQAEFQ